MKIAMLARTKQASNYTEQKPDKKVPSRFADFERPTLLLLLLLLLVQKCGTLGTHSRPLFIPPHDNRSTPFSRGAVNSHPSAMILSWSTCPLRVHSALTGYLVLVFAPYFKAFHARHFRYSYVVVLNSTISSLRSSASFAPLR